VFHELGDVLAEEREGRVGDNYIRLFQELDALRAAKVASFRKACAGVGVPLQEKLDVFDADRAVSVDILHFLNLDRNRLGFLAFAIALIVLRERELFAGDWGTVIAGGDEPFEAEAVKIGGKVFKKVALEGIVAVAVDDLAAEGVGIEFEVGLDLFLDIKVLSLELVFLGRLRCAEIAIHRLIFHSAISFLWFA
jgi:hypothetical protein